MTLLPKKVQDYLNESKDNNIREMIDDTFRVYVVKGMLYIYANDIPVHKFELNNKVSDVIMKLDEMKALSHELKLCNKQ
jgi:N-methylhydantoinase B/oxoprolinase/acetone carboxylase alpha subunit